MTRCPNSTSNPTRAPHAPVSVPTAQARTVTVATLANSHTRAIRYIDERVKAVQLDLNREHARAWRDETRKLRQTMIERILFVAVGAFLVLVAGRLALVPRITIFGVAAGPDVWGHVPDIAREVLERIRRI